MIPKSLEKLEEYDLHKYFGKNIFSLSPSIFSDFDTSGYCHSHLKYYVNLGGKWDYLEERTKAQNQLFYCHCFNTNTDKVHQFCKQCKGAESHILY